MPKTPAQKAADKAAKDLKKASDKAVKDAAATAAAPTVTPPVSPAIMSSPALPPKASAEDLGDIEVGEPEVLRPVELPLVIKPKDGGEWKNAAQAEYAQTLNGYAYKNPTKFKAKKDILLARLVEIGNNPAALQKYKAPGEGVGQKLEFKDKRFQS